MFLLRDLTHPRYKVLGCLKCLCGSSIKDTVKFSSTDGTTTLSFSSADWQSEEIALWGNDTMEFNAIRFCFIESLRIYMFL